MAWFRRRREETRTDISMGGFDNLLRLLNAYQTQFAFNGHTYTTGDPRKAAEQAVNQSAPVFSLVAVRMLVFSEVRFSYQRYRDGRPSELFGTNNLTLLERPWVGATTGDLLARMEYDASAHGNSYWVEEMGQLCRLDPCYTTVITGDVTEPLTGRKVGSRLVGYAYKEPGAPNGVLYPASMVAHYKPIASSSEFVGASWIASVLPDVNSDLHLTQYKSALVNNAATPQLVVTFEPGISPEQFQEVKAIIDADHTGSTNAFKTLYLGAGVDVKTVGMNLEQLAFKATQGAGETRLAAAAGVPVPIVGFSEGLQGSALNAGNYGASRRRFADGTMRPLWRSAAGALQNIAPPPGRDARLWYDDRDVSFLQEDVMDAAEIKQKEAYTMEALVRTGFTPDSAVEAIRTGDWSVLKHSGLVSVQLQTPGVKPELPARSEQLALPVAG